MSFRKPWTYGFILGLGYLGVSAVGPIYNTYVPLQLADFGLSASMVGFVMTWDNWLNLVIPALVGAFSDRTWTRFGRRKPWILASAPFAIVLFPLLPLASSLILLLTLILAVNLAISVLRAPGISLLGDMFAPLDRSKASGVINLLGGMGIVMALVGSGAAYDWGPNAPFLLGAGFLFGGVLVFALAVRERREWGPDPERLRSVRHWRSPDFRSKRFVNTFLLLLAIFFSFSAFNILETWISSYARFFLQQEPDRIPFIVAVFAGFLLLAAIPAGFLGSRFGQKRMIFFGMAALTALFAAGAFIGSANMLVLLLAPAGAAWAMIIINLFPLLYSVGGEGVIGMFAGLYYTVTSASAILGPQSVGFVLDMAGRDFRLMWFVAAAAMTLGMITLFFVREDGTA
ncbi:MAG: SLC45 family MFS transporter [Chloroflexi bacterium]|nr:SLC45 family MFS transporter [Chloroflexota bacterium]